MSVDEEEIQTMDNLMGRGEEIINEELVSSSEKEEEEDRIPLSVLRENLKMAKQFVDPLKRKSERRDDTFAPPNFEGPSSKSSAELRYDWTAKSYLTMYFEDELFQKVCDCTNARYVELKGVSLKLTLSEIKHFFGIVCLMFSLKYPKIRVYWAKTTKVSAIADTMTRDKFFAIRSNLKIVIDGSIAEGLPREKVVAVDEQMIPFTGTCKMKQFVRKKPNPEGLKNFVVAAPDGLVVDFELYQGKDTFPEDSVKRPSAVVRLGRTLFPGSHVYCDRYFTTIPLLEYIRQQEKYCTRTIMKFRVPAAANLISEKMMAKIGRGSSEQIVRQDGEIVIVQWYDLKSVLLASTARGIQTSDECKRWSKKDSKYIQVKRPYVVTKYNDCMGVLFRLRPNVHFNGRHITCISQTSQP
ncbi:piggyBac transposable element-derived protein 3-like [Anthonomus grandis grandis]|uniref:piggyBac transposable element-derived protein 3-like n=1 Tax=Anthonomus grandis grandis TaxID=2921223 RepID=UPI002166C12A|nr:piggyBac transposable element-derived protein 3-like [Anthonomus grandis grandis]